MLPIRDVSLYVRAFGLFGTCSLPDDLCIGARRLGHLGLYAHVVCQEPAVAGVLSDQAAMWLFYEIGLTVIGRRMRLLFGSSTTAVGKLQVAVPSLSRLTSQAYDPKCTRSWENGRVWA